MHDLVLRGGVVVDGTGRPGIAADVAISDGVIARIGTDVGDGAASLDASGCIVTPGFVDPHTHLDVQLFWDPAATPSCLHGVTTVVLGSCGFGVAPKRPGSGEYLLRSLEAVEEIPYSSTAQAVPFGWSSWSEYMDALAGLDLGVNVAAYVPHSPLRFAVLGARARTSAADDDERRALVATLEEALAAGAVGFSTSRGPNHVDADGEPVPSRLADHDEVAALAAACGERVWQVNVEAKFGRDGRELVREIERYAAWTAGTLTWSPFFVQSGSDAWRDGLEHNRRLRANGTQVLPQVSPQPITSAINFADAPPILFSVTGWGAPLAGFAELDAGGRRRHLADPEVRRALRRAGHAGTAMLDPRFADWIVAASPSRPDAVGRSVLEAVADAGGDPVSGLLDLVLADDLGTVLQIPLINDDLEGVAALNSDPGTLIGLGDAGAHVNSVTSYAYPTRVLTALVAGGHLSVEAAVHRLTQQPAAVFGLTDRGVLAEGRPADACVIDLQALALAPSELRRDLPGGASRLFQGAVGYRAVLVNGRPTVLDDTVVPAGSGRVLRV